MAKDLGELNISITADKKSFDEAGQGLGDTIRKTVSSNQPKRDNEEHQGLGETIRKAVADQPKRDNEEHQGLGEAIRKAVSSQPKRDKAGQGLGDTVRKTVSKQPKRDKAGQGLGDTVRNQPKRVADTVRDTVGKNTAEQSAEVFNKHFEKMDAQQVRQDQKTIGTLERLGSFIRGAPRRGVGGNIASATQLGASTQVGSKMTAMLKFAAVIGIASAALMVMTKIIKSVIAIIQRWHSEVDQSIRKLAAVNAQMAHMAAIMDIKQLLRDMTTAQRLAKPRSFVAMQGEKVKDAWQPVKDAFGLFKTMVVGMTLPALEMLGNALTEVTKWLLSIPRIMTHIGEFIIDVVAAVAKAILRIILPGVGLLGHLIGDKGIDIAADFYKSELGELFASMDEAAQKILEQLKRDSDEESVGAINQYIGQVGVELSNKQWNPWSNP